MRLILTAALLSCLVFTSAAQELKLLGATLSPNVRLDMAASAIEGAEFGDLILGGHDPSDDFVVQGLEPSLSLRSQHLEGYLNWLVFFDGEDWGDENEEAFLKLVNLPLLPEGSHIRGGRMLTRFGDLNNKHLHARDFRDAPMVLTSFLGDEGLAQEGGEITLPLGFGRSSAFTIGYGQAPEHEEEGHGDEEEEEHDDDEEEEEEGHEDEEVAFDGNLVTARLTSQLNSSDFHQFRGGVSTAIGEDEEGDDLKVHGVDVTYAWRENGLEPGGRQLRWTTEILLRDTEEGDSQFGGYSKALWRFSEPFEAGLRVGILDAPDDDENTAWRISPLVAWYPTPLTAVRLQGSHVELPNGEDAQSVTLGLSMSLSNTPEVR